MCFPVFFDSMVYRQTDTSCETTCKALWFVTGVSKDAFESWGTGAYSDTPSALNPRRCVSFFSVLIQFFARRFSNILEIRAVFNSLLLSSRLSFWFLFTENEYVSLCSIYVPPVMLLFLLDQGLWGPFFFSDFFPFNSCMSLHFFLQNGKFWVSCGLVSVWGKRGREKQATPMFLSICLHATRLASPMWLQPREGPPLWWPWQTKQMEQSHFLKSWTYLENQV